jgi:RNA polymerase sigma-70 factor (ECF subfamily)
METPVRTSPDIAFGPRVEEQAPDRLAGLLVAAAGGDHLAFSELYDATSSRVYGMTMRVLRDAHQAEEVVQEVFLETWQTASRFDPGRGSVVALLMTTAHRRAVDRVRSSEAARRRDQADADLRLETPFDSTSSAAEGRVDAWRVRSALTALSTLQREAVVLAYFGGHTHTEISRLLDIPVGTAKTRIRDGLLKLREAFAGANAQLV